MKIKIGQRFLYKTSSGHFIAEIIEGEKYEIIQYFSGVWGTKEQYWFSEHDFQLAKWTYLKGQDKPCETE